MPLAGDHVRVFVSGYELTGDHNRITINDARKMLEATAFGQAVQNYLPGQRQSSLEHRGYVNETVGRSHRVLNGADLSGVVSLFLGQNTAPTLGDPVYSLGILQNQYSPLPKVGGVIPFTAKFS